MSLGNVENQKILLEKWRAAGDYATNKGSRVHFELEKYILKKNNINKNIREPIFKCDDQQIIDSNNMIIAGEQFLDLMESRGCIIIDTEVILGSPILGYVGQADNIWVCLTKDKNNVGFLITDHKTNAIKNLMPQVYNEYLKPPFDSYRDYAITHYYIQISLYAKLFIEMMKNTKYEGITYLGGVLDSLRSDKTFEEYRVPKYFYNKIIEMIININ
jgi:hypothetical protein